MSKSQITHFKNYFPEPLFHNNNIKINLSLT